MKARISKILILVLALTLLLCGCGKGAYTTTYSVDGLVVVMTSDKNAYTGAETAKVDMEIINNTGKEIAVSADVKTPDGLAVDLETLGGNFKAEPGKVVTLYDIGIKLNPIGLILWIVGGVLVAAAAVVVAIIIIRKGKTKEAVAMLLCVCMLGGMLAYIQPLQAEASFTDNDEEAASDYAGEMTVSHPVLVDGREVYIEAVLNYEIGLPVTPEYDPLIEETDWEDPDSKKPNGKLLAWYYNDYDGDHAQFDRGTTVNMKDHVVELGGTQEQGHLRFEITNELGDATYQADFRDNQLVDNFVVHVRVSTENDIPEGTYMLYRYNTGSNTALFSFKDNYLRIGSTNYNKVTPGSWLEMDLVFDLSQEASDYCTYYVNGQKLVTQKLPKHEALYKIPYVRFHVKGAENIGKTFLVDDFYAYPSKDIMPVDEINSPNYPYWERASAGPDVAMVYPELSDLGNKVIAVMAGTDKAYVNGEVVTMSAVAGNASSGDVFTDAFVPGDFLEKYLGVTGLEASQQYSLLRYATGKNVVVDGRGLIILTEDVKLSADKDFRLISMLAGYLATGKLVNNYAVLPALNQDMIDKAVHNIDLYMVEATSHSFEVMLSDVAMYYLVMATYLDPTLTSSDGISVEAEATRRVKTLLAGGNEPYASVGCYWDHGVVSSTILLAKHTPVIWNQLTDEEVKRADLLMECLAIAANWGYNLENNYKTGFNLAGNYGKDYNPNYLNSYFTCYLNANMYFGGEKLDEIFVNFDHATYVERLKEAGMVNILYEWTIEDNLGLSIGYYMENGGELLMNGATAGSTQQKAGDKAGSGVGVKVPFKYEGLHTRQIYDSSQLLEMFIEALTYTYSWKVKSSNQAPGSMFYSYILTMVESPWKGQMGMLREFAVGEDRSKVQYSYLSVVNMGPLYANFKLLGYWDYDANPELAQKMLEMDNRIYVGTEDFYFKLHQGYQGCSQRKQVLEYEEDFVGQGADLLEDIFMNFHFMKNHKIQYTQPEIESPLLDAAEPMNGVTEPPEGAIPAKGRTPSQLYVTDFYAPFDGMGYTSGKLNFDMVVEDKLPPEGYNVVIAIDKKFPGKGYAESPMLIAFSQAQGISIMNRSEYLPLGMFFGPNYRFHVEMEFDCASRTYSGKITQTWPETEEPISKTFENYGFRTTSGTKWTFVDSIMAVTPTGHDSMWLENVQVEGNSLVPPVPDVKEDVTVRMDLSAVPYWARPAELKVNLGIGDWVSPRTVTFTAADGWSNKVFDNLPKTINLEPVDWNVSISDKIPGYYSRVIKNGENDYTIKWSDTNYFYDHNFETWKTGEFKAGNTPIYDHLDNVLQDYNDNAGRAPFTRGAEASGNHYLKIGDAKKPMQATFNLDKGTDAGVYVFKMRLKLENADAMISGTHLATRYLVNEKAVKNQFIDINKNVVKVGGYGIATLTADAWTEFMVILDFNTGYGEVFYDDPGYRRTFALEPICSHQVTLYASPGTAGLCLDDLQVYTTSGLKVTKPADEANKNAELIVPETPIPELDPAYKWYYNADFEYWNKSAYVAGKTEIKDAYGNVMVDMWSSTTGPLVRGDEGNGNHYLEFNSPKSMQAGLQVDKEYDDGTYIMKWRMKLKDAESVIKGAVVSYRYNGSTKHDFVSIEEKGVTACGTSLGKLTADAWMELMVVLDFTTMTATVCDWEGHKIGSTTLKNMIGSSQFNIWAAGGTKGLCIDDLQLYSGSVTILDPLPGQPEEPEEPEVITDFFKSDFEGALETEPNGETFTYLLDADGNKLRVYNDLFKVEDGYLALSGSADAGRPLFYVSGSVDGMDISFKVRLPDAETMIPGGKNNMYPLALRTHKSETGAILARFYGQTLSIGGKTYTLTTDWTEVVIHVNYKTDEATYSVNGEEGSFAFTGTYDRLELYALTQGAFTLHFDDLHICNCVHVPDPEATTVDVDAKVIWDDSNDDDEIRPESINISLYNGLNLIDRVEVTAAENWKHTFAELPRFDAEENEINYTLIVSSADMPEGYTAAVNGASITLSHTPETVYLYKNDFANVIGNTGGTIADLNDRKISVVEGGYEVTEDGYLIVRGDAAASKRMFYIGANATDHPVLDIRFKVRLENESTQIPGGHNNLYPLVLRTHNTDTNSKVVRFYEQKVQVGSDSCKLNATDWVEVYVQIDFANGKLYYTLTDGTDDAPKSGNVAFTGQCNRLELYAMTEGEFGVCIDDLQISKGVAHVPDEEPTEPEITEPETDPTEPETDPTEPETDPTEPETDPTEPEVTEPETDPTEPETEPTEPETEPTEPETEPTEPDPDVYYDNDFSVPADGSAGTLADAANRTIAMTSGYYEVTEGGYLVVRGDAANSKRMFYIGAQATNVLDIRFKVRLENDSIQIPGGKNNLYPLVLRLHNTDTNSKVVRFYEQKVQVGSDSCDLNATDWVEVYVQIDFANGKLYYELTDGSTDAPKSGNVAYTGQYNRTELYAMTEGEFGVCIDDLQISKGVAHIPDEEPTEPEVTEPETDPTEPETDPTEPETDPTEPETEPTEPEKIQLDTAITWDDADDFDLIRPESVFVSVYNGLNLVKREQVFAANNWQHTFTELPKYDAEENEIGYTVVVTSDDLPERYTAAISGAAITLTHVSNVNLWKFNSDFQNAVLKEETSTTYDYILDGKNRELRVNEGQYRLVTEADGNVCLELIGTKDKGYSLYSSAVATVTDISFRVRCDANTSVMKMDIRSHNNATNRNIGSINGKYITLGSTSVDMSKGWLDISIRIDTGLQQVTYCIVDADGVAHRGTTTAAAETNRFEIAKYANGDFAGLYIDDFQVRQDKADASAQLVWDDENDHDGYRPEAVTLNLLQEGSVVATAVVNEENNWQVTFAGYNLYDAAGAAVAYTYDVAALPDGYTKAVQGATITLSHPSVVTWFYRNDFDGELTVTTGTNNSIFDKDGHSITAKSSAYAQVAEGENKFLRYTLNGETARIFFAQDYSSAAQVVDISFRVRLISGSFPTANTVSGRVVLRTGSGEITGVKVPLYFTGEKVYVNGNGSPNATLSADGWTDVHLRIDAANDSITYTLNGETNTVTSTLNELGRLELYASGATTVTMDLDDLKIYTVAE